MNSYLVKAESTSETEKLLASIIDQLPPDVIFTKRTDFHCPLLFAISWTTLPKLISYNRPKTYTIQNVDLFGNAIVLILDATSDSFIVRRHHVLKRDMIATTQHPVYTPHLTIGYTVKDIPIDLELLKQHFTGIKISLKRETGKTFR